MAEIPQPDHSSSTSSGFPSDLPRPNLTGASFDAKWDLLKPWIQRLYLDEGKPLPDVRRIIKNGFGFDAPPHSFKYHFKKWGWEKSLSSADKWHICNTLHTRASIGKLTEIKHLGRKVEAATLRRHLKDSTRQAANCDLVLASGSNKNVVASSRILKGKTEQGIEWKRLTGSAAMLGNSIFLNWNLPFHAMLSYGTKQKLFPSPPTPQAASLAVTIKTPSGSPTINNKELSPLTKSLNEIYLMDRTKMFVEGRHFDLVKSLNTDEQKIMSDWLYQYWYFSFKTAKHWGHGPREWTSEILLLDKFRPGTPRSLSASPLLGTFSKSGPSVRDILSPPILCRYTIHCSPDMVVVEHEDDTISVESMDLQDPLDESSWRSWPVVDSNDYQSRLQDGLVSNAFSTVPKDSVPINTAQIGALSKETKGSFLKEATGFAIMGRNLDLLDDLLEDVFYYQLCKSEDFYPLHIATSYLDGSRTCCLIAQTLAGDGFHHKQTNSLGFNVIDNLLLTILRSHTSMLPVDIDDRLRGEKRLPGEEIDICGRWDADSDCYRDLISKGFSRVPNEWKHKFCHTSIQTICECLSTIAYLHYGFMSNVPSVLYSKLCTHCGLRGELFPLHVLVLTTVNLARFGMDGEDLFGMIAIALCLLACGVDGALTCAMSTSLYFDSQAELELSAELDELVCLHNKMTAAQLATSGPLDIIKKWSPTQQRNWSIFCLILERAAVQQKDEEFDWYDLEELDECCHGDIYEESRLKEHRDLGILWSSIQAELLTYRRLKESDPWISANIDLDKVLHCLRHNVKMSTGKLTDDSMVKATCICGLLKQSMTPMCCRAEFACNSHFMNLDKRWDLLRVIPPCRYYGEF